MSEHYVELGIIFDDGDYTNPAVDRLKHRIIEELGIEFEISKITTLKTI